MNRKGLTDYHQPLTDEESKFAEDYHNLIYSYLHENSLAIDEYYDIAAIGYVKAVQGYFRIEKLKKYSFKTIAFNYMLTEVGNYHKANRRYNAHIIYFDDKDKNIEEILPYPHNDYENIEIAEEIEELFSLLSEKNKKVFILLSMGYDSKNIAVLMGLTEREVYQKVYRSRKRIKAYLAAK